MLNECALSFECFNIWKCILVLGQSVEFIIENVKFFFWFVSFACLLVLFSLFAEIWSKLWFIYYSTGFLRFLRNSNLIEKLFIKEFKMFASCFRSVDGFAVIFCTENAFWYFFRIQQRFSHKTLNFQPPSLVHLWYFFTIKENLPRIGKVPLLV